MDLNPRKSQPSRSAGGQASSQRHASIDFEPPKLFKVLRNFLIIGVAIAVASVVYTLYWFMIATNLKDAVTNWISDQIQSCSDRTETANLGLKCSTRKRARW